MNINTIYNSLYEFEDYFTTYFILCHNECNIFQLNQDLIEFTYHAKQKNIQLNMYLSSFEQIINKGEEFSKNDGKFGENCSKCLKVFQRWYKIYIDLSR